MTVQTIPDIKDMTPAQRVELMEALWKEMEREAEKTEPPDWHFKVLNEREKALSEDRTQFVDWERAKADIILRTVNRKR